MNIRLDHIAHTMMAARDHARLTRLPSEVQGGLTLAEGFDVAQALSLLREARGDERVGWKIGFTNRSIWERYGVHAPIWGPVWRSTFTQLEGTEAEVSLEGLCQPRLEPEVVFGLAHAPEPGMDLDDLRDCIAWVAHGFEIVHTHYEGWRFTAPDTLADFALHGRLVVGPRVSVADWDTLAADLAGLQVELVQGGAAGEVRDRGHGHIVLDGPLNALHEWVNAMALHTPAWQPQPGEVVTTGTLTDAWPLEPGQRWATRLSLPLLSGLSLVTTA